MIADIVRAAKYVVRQSKYTTIILYSMITHCSVVDLYGSTWVVSGNVVVKVR